MSILANFPLVSQLTQVTSDGRPSENAQYDCVPASIGAGILWYQGKHQWDSEVNPDLLKDRAYGEDWKNNGTAAKTYVDVVAKMGIKLYSIDGNPAQLVQHAHEELAKQHPVIFTEPDPYVPASYGWSHVGVFYADTPGELTCLDPYIAKPITRSDAEWANMLMFNQIWIEEKISMSTIPQGWRDDGQTLVSPNNVPVVKGFRAYVLAHNWDAGNYPLEAEYGAQQVEGSNPSLGAGTEQPFRKTVLEWTQARGVFEMWTGQELTYTRAQLLKAYNLNQQLQAQLKAQGDSTAIHADMQQIKTISTKY